MLNTEVKTALKQSIAVCANISELKQNNYILIFALQQNFAFIFAQKLKQCNILEEFFCFLNYFSCKLSCFAQKHLLAVFLKATFDYEASLYLSQSHSLSSINFIASHPCLALGISHEQRCLHELPYTEMVYSRTRLLNPLF